MNRMKKKKFGPLPIYNKKIYLYPIGYLKPWEITNKIFPIKMTDDER